jgi:hypothetical protein
MVHSDDCAAKLGPKLGGQGQPCASLREIVRIDICGTGKLVPPTAVATDRKAGW